MALAVGSSIHALAKDAPITAIVLFDGAQGAAYVQVAGVTLNGKAEMRVCDGVAKFDKNAYNALPRVPIKEATVLQRGEDGVLTLTVNEKPFCVVPGNIRFDNKPVLTPAEAAEQAVLQGAAVSASGPDAGLPALKPRVQLVFVPAPDVELADFLCAQRASSIKGWQDFVGRHPSSGRLADARSAIAALHEQVAEAAFAQYQKSTASGKQDLTALRQAYMEAQAARQAFAAFNPAVKLMDSVGRELESLAEPDRARLQAFQKSLQEHGSAYSQLVMAKVHLNQLLEVRADYAPVLNLQREIQAEEQKLEAGVANAESLSASGRYDDALNSLGLYISLAPEVPRVAAVVNAAYTFHFKRGQRLADQQEWQPAVAEFRKACAIRPDSSEAGTALSNATIQFTAQHDQQAANLAVLQSNDYAGQGQFVEAYNTLADLPDKQRALVASQLSALAPNFVSAATRRAQKLQEGHIPIKGRADEDAVREAYTLLSRATSITGDPAITLKRDFLSSKISAYYADQAIRYLEKPAGSGIGIGWLYLTEADRFGITNLNDLKNEAGRYASLYQRRARLSVGVTLRDQTSRRDSPGFAEQLADAIANGLESSGVLVEIVRKPSEADDSLQPNFLVSGEVLEHRVVKNENLEALQSKYRAGTRETRNPAWVQARIDYESAQQQLAAAQLALTDAQSRHKKDVITAATQSVQDAQKHADEVRHKLETTDPKRLDTVVEPYHYTRKTVDLSASIELALRIVDRSGNVIGQPVDVRKNNRESTVVLQDVKPEDTEGITSQSVEPDQAQFLTDLEIEARNEVVKAVRAKATELSGRVLQEARTRVQHGDLDGAAEQYVIYLNSAPETSSPDRDEATRFLHDRYNLTAAVASKP